VKTHHPMKRLAVEADRDSATDFTDFPERIDEFRYS